MSCKILTGSDGFYSSLDGFAERSIPLIVTPGPRKFRSKRGEEEMKDVGQQLVVVEAEHGTHHHHCISYPWKVKKKAKDNYIKAV